MYRIAINGFGRIGRNIVRALYERPELQKQIQIVAINDLGSLEINAHLLQFDTVHGRFNQHVEVTDGAIVINGDVINWSSERDPTDLPWAELDVDLVCECTGVFTSREKAALHLEAGAKKVLISAPGSDVDATVVFGVNDHVLDGSQTIISNASCTTNCLSPIAKVLHETVGITKGFMTTIHSYTGDQPTLDTMHSDLYRARAAALSMIPTSTGAAKAVGLVLPELCGKLDGVAIRVPTPNVSVVDLTFEASKATSVAEINAAIKVAADGPLKGVLGYTDACLVSTDFNHDPHSSIFHMDQTNVLDGNMVRILSWYDNEWGFSNRMADTAVAMGKLI